MYNDQYPGEKPGSSVLLYYRWLVNLILFIVSLLLKLQKLQNYKSQALMNRLGWSHQRCYSLRPENRFLVDPLSAKLSTEARGGSLWLSGHRKQVRTGDNRVIVGVPHFWCLWSHFERLNIWKVQFALGKFIHLLFSLLSFLISWAIEEKRQLVQGTITERERLSTVDLLIKVTDFVKKR